MVFDFSAIRVPRQKHYSDSTLMTWNKKELIEYIRMLEHNYDVSIQFNENQAQYIERFCPFFKAYRKTEPTISKMEQVDKDINVRSKYEPKICDTCRYYNSNIPCGSTPSACKEADKFAEEFVDGLKKLKPTISKMEQVEEPQIEGSE